MVCYKKLERIITSVRKLRVHLEWLNLKGEEDLNTKKLMLANLGKIFYDANEILNGEKERERAKVKKYQKFKKMSKFEEG